MPTRLGTAAFATVVGGVAVVGGGAGCCRPGRGPVGVGEHACQEQQRADAAGNDPEPLAPPQRARVRRAGWWWRSPSCWLGRWLVWWWWLGLLPPALWVHPSVRQGRPPFLP